MSPSLSGRDSAAGATGFEPSCRGGVLVGDAPGSALPIGRDPARIPRRPGASPGPACLVSPPPTTVMFPKALAPILLVAAAPHCRGVPGVW